MSAVVVSNSSPLIYLSRIGHLSVLHALFEEIVVPGLVWTEVALGRPAAPGVGDLLAADWIRVDARDLPQEDLGLDPGETSAIQLAEALDDSLLLIDERMGRRVASARGLAIRGTLGVLVQARENDVIAALRPVLDAMVAEGFRLAPALQEMALARVGE